MNWGIKEARLPVPEGYDYHQTVDRETVNLRNLDKAISDPLWALADGLRKLSYGDMMKLAQAIDSRQGPMADRLFNWAVEYIDPPQGAAGDSVEAVEPSKPERRP